MVDAAHKVRDGAMTPAQGLESLAQARKSVDANWTAYLATQLLPQEVQLVERFKHLQAKALGGGNVNSSHTGVSIGERNAEFARQWLAREGISLLASDLMGPWSRKVILDPQTGDVFCKRGQTSQSIVEAEKSYASTLVVAPKKTDIELF